MNTATAKRRKGQFRRLWIARISAAVRDRKVLTYSALWKA